MLLYADSCGSSSCYRVLLLLLSLPLSLVLVITSYEKNMADIFESIFRKYLTSLTKPYTYKVYDLNFCCCCFVFFSRYFENSNIFSPIKTSKVLVLTNQKIYQILHSILTNQKQYQVFALKF